MFSCQHLDDAPVTTIEDVNYAWNDSAESALHAASKMVTYYVAIAAAAVVVVAVVVGVVVAIVLLVVNEVLVATKIL